MTHRRGMHIMLELSHTVERVFLESDITTDNNRERICIFLDIWGKKKKKKVELGLPLQPFHPQGQNRSQREDSSTEKAEHESTFDCKSSQGISFPRLKLVLLNIFILTIFWHPFLVFMFLNIILFL